MVGVVLLLVTLAYGLTGYLLPWDNRAYWGTVVTTQIAAQAPGAGAVPDAPAGRRRRDRRGDLRALLRPARAAAAAGHHVADRAARVTWCASTAWRPRRATNWLPKKKFYPEQVFKDTVAIFIAFAVLFTLAVAVRVPLEQLADPTDTVLHSAARVVFPVPVPDAEALQRPARGGRQRRAARSGGAGAAPGAVYRSRPSGEGDPADRGLRASCCWRPSAGAA